RRRPCCRPAQGRRRSEGRCSLLGSEARRLGAAEAQRRGAACTELGGDAGRGGRGALLTGAAARSVPEAPAAYRELPAQPDRPPSPRRPSSLVPASRAGEGTAAARCRRGAGRRLCLREAGSPPSEGAGTEVRRLWAERPIAPGSRVRQIAASLRGG